ncbi:hypothetical protein COBT_000453 [Conglomerata obtusa]
MFIDLDLDIQEKECIEDFLISYLRNSYETTRSVIETCNIEILELNTEFIFSTNSPFVSKNIGFKALICAASSFTWSNNRYDLGVRQMYECEKLSNTKLLHYDYQPHCVLYFAELFTKRYLKVLIFEKVWSCSLCVNFKGVVKAYAMPYKRYIFMVVNHYDTFEHIYFLDCEVKMLINGDMRANLFLQEFHESIRDEKKRLETFLYNFFCVNNDYVIEFISNNLIGFNYGLFCTDYRMHYIDLQITCHLKTLNGKIEEICKKFAGSNWDCNIFNIEYKQFSFSLDMMIPKLIIRPFAYVYELLLIKYDDIYKQGYKDRVMNNPCYLFTMHFLITVMSRDNRLERYHLIFHNKNRLYIYCDVFVSTELKNILYTTAKIKSKGYLYSILDLKKDFESFTSTDLLITLKEKEIKILKSFFVKIELNIFINLCLYKSFRKFYLKLFHMQNVLKDNFEIHKLNDDYVPFHPLPSIENEFNVYYNMNYYKNKISMFYSKNLGLFSVESIWAKAKMQQIELEEVLDKFFDTIKIRFIESFLCDLNDDEMCKGVNCKAIYDIILIPLDIYSSNENRDLILSVFENQIYA